MNVDFGPRIKQLRKQRNITQQVLADVLGITKTMVSAYENGIRKPSLDNLMQIALFFDVSMDWMFANTEDKHGSPALDITQLTRNQRNIIIETISEFKRQNRVEKELFDNRTE